MGRARGESSRLEAAGKRLHDSEGGCVGLKEGKGANQDRAICGESGSRGSLETG